MSDCQPTIPLCEGSNGCLGTYWCGWWLKGKDRWSLGSIMWVWWNRFLLGQRCKTWIIISSHPKVHLTSLYFITLHLSYMLEAQHLHCYIEGRAFQVHLDKVTFDGTICERSNKTCRALSELRTWQTHSAPQNDIHCPAPRQNTG